MSAKEYTDYISAHSPSVQQRWLGEDCIFHDKETENNCHYSMFVRRKCIEGACPDLGQYPEDDDSEVMMERIKHAVTVGREGEWTPRDKEVKK